MKIFVINLDRRPDRLAEITERLKTLGLEFERVSAFDGQQQSVFGKVCWFKAYVYAGLKLPLRGAIGCYFSHRSVWQKMIDHNIKQALVLEDDAIPINWDDRILDLKLDELKLDQLRLEGLTIVYNKQWTEGALLPDTKQQVLGRAITSQPSYGTAAYMISLEGARKCLSINKFWFNVDHFDVWQCMTGVRTALLNPPMWEQAPSSSDIADVDVPRHNKSIRELLWRLRRPFVRFCNKRFSARLRSQIRKAAQKNSALSSP